MWTDLLRWNLPGKRLHTTSNALLSARSLAIKTEIKEFSQNLEVFSFKINA
jgi:hypothetical protein